MVMTWQLLRDTDNDGVFDDSDVLSGTVMSVNIQRGFEDVFDRVARPARAVVIVKNLDGSFFPEAGGSFAFAVGQYLQIRATESPTTYTLFTGLFEHVRRLDRMRAEITIVSRFSLFGQQVKYPFYEDVVTSDILTDLFTLHHIDLRRPAYDWITNLPYCVINTHSLDACYVWPDELNDIDFDTGQTTLSYFGGVTPGTTTLRTLVEDVTNAEAGQCYEEADGTIRWRNRHSVLTDVTVQQTYTNPRQYGYKYGGDVYNVIRGVVIPRKKALVTAWTAAARRKVAQGESFQYIRFTADNGRVMGVSDDTGPLADLEFENNAGVSTASLADVTYSIERVHHDGVEIRFNNSSGVGRFISAGSTIQATTLTQMEDVELEAREDSHLVGRRELDYPGLEMLDVEEAQGIINYTLQQFSLTRGWAEYVEVEDDAGALALELLDLVRVNISESNHNQLYRVQHIEHTAHAGRCISRLTLRPAFDENYIVIDVTGRNLIDTGSIAY